MIYQYTLAPVEFLLESAFIILSGITNSYFIGLVLLAFVVRVVTKPLDKYASRSVAKQAEIESVLAAQVNAIKKKYSAAQRHEAIKRLYARYSYRPIYAIRSLASLGVQLPFFIAAYFMITDFTQLSGSIVPVLGDLGKPDTLLFSSIHLMPFIMTLVNILVLLTVPRFSRKGLIQGLFISLMFLVLLYESPLALLIYWTTNNLLSLISNVASILKNKFKLRKSKFRFKDTFIGKKFEEYAYLLFVTDFAIIVPLLGVLGDQFNFFTAHNLSSQFIITLLIIISVTPFLLLTILRWVCKQVRLVTAFDSVILFVFSGLFLFYSLNKISYGIFPSKYEPYILFSIALVLAVIVAVFVLKKQLLRNLSYLSLIIPLVLLHFVFVSPASTLFKHAHEGGGQSLGMNDTPVFLLIFDEFSGLTLQNMEGQLDRSRYPGFAELATQADYFPNALTAHGLTDISVPSIASGNLRLEDKAGLAPGENLIELFKANSSLDAYSTVLPADLMAKQEVNLISLASDFLTLYIHIISHKDWIEDRIGGIPQSWKDFGVFFKDKKPKYRNRHERQFIDWMRRVESVGVNSQFNFLHFQIPHAFYTTTSLGRHIYNSGPIHKKLFDNSFILKNVMQSHLDVVYHNYIQQSSYVDSLMLDFLRVLKKRELFDKSLIIVTSDHGVSYSKNGLSRRAPVNEDSWKNIISVPLFIKYPYQKENSVNSSFVTTLDISSTVLGVVGINSPWESVGQNLKGIKNNVKTRSVELVPGYEKYFENSRALFRKALARKKNLFSEAIPVHEIAVNYTGNSVYTALLGKEMPETTDVLSNFNVAYDGLLKPEEITFYGTIYDGLFPVNNKIIAAVVNNKIQAVFESGKVQDRDGFFAFSLPEKKAVPMKLDVALYEIEGRKKFRFRKMEAITLQVIKTMVRRVELKSKFSKSEKRYDYDWKKSVLKTHGLKDIRLVKNGLKVLSIKNEDPYVVFGAVSETVISEPILNIIIESNKEQSMSLYYQTSHMSEFNESQQVHFGVKKGSNSIYINIPEKDFMGSFRIDMDQWQSTEVIIENIELRQ